MDAVIGKMLERVGDVAATYCHDRRPLTSLAPQCFSGDNLAVLKWYLLAPEGEPAAPALVERARSFVASEFERGRLSVPYGLGFVVLHHSTVLDYLIVGAWRFNQELWSTHYTRDATGDATFQPARPGVDASTLCVWELAPVWHEREAWVRYLESPRDLPARREWLEDVLRGEV